MPPCLHDYSKFTDLHPMTMSKGHGMNEQPLTRELVEVLESLHRTLKEGSGHTGSAAKRAEATGEGCTPPFLER
jgi:hypothetical protein